MKKLKFRYISAKNFMCFGPDGIEIFFDDMGEVILVNGLNLDTGTPSNPASNGAGKSAIQDIISYGLYGKTVKKPKKLDHDSVIHTLYKKKLEVVVEFDDYRVVRKREPSSLKLWRSKDHLWDKDSEVTKGGSNTENQKVINAAIGLSHNAFCNVVVFDDSNSYAFLELDLAGKREMVENLLELDRYRDYHQVAKDELKEVKTKIKDLTKEYEMFQNSIETQEKHILKITSQEESWKFSKNKSVQDLLGIVKEKQSELEKFDDKAAFEKYEKAQFRIEEINNSLVSIQSKKTQLIESMKTIRTKYESLKEKRDLIQSKMQEHNINVRRYVVDIQKSNELVNSLDRLEEGASCPVCHGLVNKQNYQSVLNHENNTIQGCNDKVRKEKDQIQKLQVELEATKQSLHKIESQISEVEQFASNLEIKNNKDRLELVNLNKIEKPETEVRQKVLESEIVELKKQIKEKQIELLGDSPYKEILESAIQEKEKKVLECSNKTKQLKEAEDDLPYYDFWVDAFGDKGIRKTVIDGIIPSLNSRISYWMSCLIDGKIELKFDNELKETIKVCGLETSYHGMSNGEKRRINLAVTQAFAYVMMLNSGNCPSIVFLDEITGGGIDKAGVVGIYNMIFELAKERQVFVTTHNETLINMMQGCDNILLVKKDKVTKLN